MARKTGNRPDGPVYSVHPAVAYNQKIIDNLPDTTGRSLAEWVALVVEEGPAGEKERRDWLARAHGLGGTKAWLIAENASGGNRDVYSPEGYLAAAPGYVEAMYAGPKAGLRPIHDAILRTALALGADVKVCPCQTIVPLYREHVFAQIKPTTRTRIDLGFALKGSTAPLTPRLIDTGGLAKKDRITHRIPIASLDDVDAEVGGWLAVAYHLGAAE